MLECCNAAIQRAVRNAEQPAVKHARPLWWAQRARRAKLRSCGLPPARPGRPEQPWTMRQRRGGRCCTQWAGLHRGEWRFRSCMGDLFAAGAKEDLQEEKPLGTPKAGRPAGNCTTALWNRWLATPGGINALMHWGIGALRHCDIDALGHCRCKSQKCAK